MVTIVKHEWHQTDVRYAIELDEALLSEIYPDLDEDEIAEKLQKLADGEIDVEEIVNDAYDNDVEIEWDHQDDDMWTMRKGGYDVTYELGDEDSWHTPATPPEPTHKCTKCKWTGQSYDADWVWPEDDETGEAKKVCPYCESDTELTEHGIQEEKESAERMARWAKEAKDAEEEVPCFSCGTMHKESELPEMSGQYHCPDCGDGWVMMESRDDEDDEVSEEELEKALAELKAEFETLSNGSGWDDPSVPIEDLLDAEEVPAYPPGVYTIRIWGRTREIGVSKIKKAQYDYWSDEDHEDDLSDALNENYDYDENKTPKAARFELPYYEYQDKISFWGFDEDDTHVTVTDADGNEIYEGDMGWFEGEEVEELYPEYLGKGYWLMWTQGGKGSCLQVTIDTGDEGFDPNAITYTTWDINGSSVINRVLYDGVELDDEGMDSEHDNWRGQWSQFDVYHNAK